MPADVQDWILSRSSLLHVSIMTVIEIEQGIAKLRRQGATRRADLFAIWLSDTTALYGRQLIAIDLGLAPSIGSLSDHGWAIGRHPGLADIVMAATAQAHDLVLLTKNLRHFEPLGIPVVDPFVSLPP